MNATDLQKLAGHLREHGLQVVALEPELRLHAMNPLHGLLSEEIVAVERRYVTSFGFEIGEEGLEEECARRVAHLLAASGVPQGGAP
ncbi:hypothetical protein ABZ172_16525 [Streptomyces sp. NPDC006296]|uniref:hypothetical protein n=1 Tax=Streptomyces sp. NPDC006296 TaxID=3156746 RepID=UPI0033ACF4F9